VRDDLLGYYTRELTFLRQLGAEFAEKYPKIASRLLLEPDRCEDPHVERLIEAFAFLAARVHLKIDDDFPELTEALLGIIYPHYLRPIPSMSVVEFHPDPEQGKLTTGLKIRLQDTRYRANRLFHETLYPADHPYHYSIRGTIESVSALTVDELRAFHARTFGPAGMVIVIVGAVSATQAIDTVRAHFGDWHNPAQVPAAPIPDAPQVSTGQRTFTQVSGKTQSDLVIGLPGPSRLSPDYDAASIANSVLGQFGMMGRVGATVREELGLAYYVYSSMDAGIGRGAWSVTAGVNPKNVDLAAERIRDEIRRLTTEPISAQELADNQSYFIGRLPLQLESNEGLAGAILNMELYNLGLDYLLNYRARIQAVTAEAVLAAARRYLDADRLVMAVAGPAD
jgi:zinc protease